MRKTLAALLIGSGLMFSGAGVAAAQPILVADDDNDVSDYDQLIKDMWAHIIIIASNTGSAGGR